MPRYRLHIAYDGTAYAGWQVQPRDMTVQEKIESVLLQLTGTRCKVHGSGRTDQGVHARCQVAHTDIEKAWKPGRLQQGLNALLPPDIRVLRVMKASLSFHARCSAVSKEYRYFIWNADVLPPHKRLTYTHIRQKLDIEAMRAAAAGLVGCHDFAAFTANSKRGIESTVRLLTTLEIRQKGSEIMIRAAGEGFLYKMVRSLAGFLIKVGKGEENAESARDILASRERTARVPTARPQGLFLWSVHY